MDEYKANNAYAAMNIYKSLSDREMAAFVRYLEEKPETLPPFFYIAVADYIYKKDKDKASLWYYIGKLRVYEDVMMCKDETARGQLAMYPMLAENTIRHMADKMTDTDYTIKIFQASLDWDEVHPQRVSPIWACYHGATAFMHQPELLPDSEFERIKKEVRGQVELAIKNRKNKEFVKKLEEFSKEYNEANK